MQTAFVGLGSNLGRPVLQVRAALCELDALQETRLMQQSSLYRSPPLGPAGQPDYINAVARLKTRLAPHALLDRLQDIEQQHGRVRGKRWGPRTLDLDLLLFGDRRIASERLRVPHPEMARRPFVLFPLSEIAPDLTLPGIGPLALLLRDLPSGGLRRLPEDDDG